MSSKYSLSNLVLITMAFLASDNSYAGKVKYVCYQCANACNVLSEKAADINAKTRHAELVLSRRVKLVTGFADAVGNPGL